MNKIIVIGAVVLLILTIIGCSAVNEGSLPTVRNTDVVDPGDLIPPTATIPATATEFATPTFEPPETATTEASATPDAEQKAIQKAEKLITSLRIPEGNIVLKYEYGKVRGYRAGVPKDDPNAEVFFDGRFRLQPAIEIARGNCGDSGVKFGVEGYPSLESNERPYIESVTQRFVVNGGTGDLSIIPIDSKKACLGIIVGPSGLNKYLAYWDTDKNPKSIPIMPTSVDAIHNFTFNEDLNLMAK
jgi:hypothetical protein